jgi:hypothetical protein
MQVSYAALPYRLEGLEHIMRFKMRHPRYHAT